MTAAPRFLGAAAGVALDRLVGEPPAAHPVACYGRLMAAAEARLWHDSRGWGAAFATGGVGLGAAAGAALHGALARVVRHGPAGGPELASTAVATGMAVAGRALAGEARAVAAALAAGDVASARALLPALCGRDPDVLDDKGVARATVESVAENTVDAVVAPVFWAALGGAPGAWAYRAANTLDAMVGHRSPRHLRFGWAAARLDDVANWLPARLTAVLVAAVRPAAAAEVAAVLRRPPAHPSPNAAVSEAAFAVALGVRLGGDTVYDGRVDPRPTFGAGRPPEPSDIEAAVRLSADVTAALAAALTGLGLLAGARGRWRR
ncbi:MAG TPA: adenosylcobinamide-phosphate synthase CbiB [Acidimicrobiia bacterium]|jgi:adenosylcobinamide-phosphate synthase